MSDNLGQGLSSLIPPKNNNSQSQFSGSARQQKSEEKIDSENILFIEVGKIKSNPHQPRKSFDKLKLQELANSIKEHGILQPLVLTKTEDGYQLIAGERRLEAAKIVGLPKVPAIIRDSSEQGKLELALIENIQRDNLNPIENAYAFKKLINEFNFTQQEVGKKIGKSRESIANTLRLLNLPAEIQRAILENKIKEGHGRVILSIPNVDKQLLFLKEIIKNNLSIRQAETMANKINRADPGRPKRKIRKDAQLKELEEKLENVLGTRVRLTKKGKKGKIVIEFFSSDELNNIIKKLSKK